MILLVRLVILVVSIVVLTGEQFVEVLVRRREVLGKARLHSEIAGFQDEDPREFNVLPIFDR